MTTHATVAGAVKRQACEKLRTLGYKVGAHLSIAQVCELICQHTGRPYPFDYVPFMHRFATEGGSVRATSPDWNCMERPAYKMDIGMQIAARRAKESL